MKQEEREQRYARVTRAYYQRFGELPPMLRDAGPALELCLELMEQALAGKRGRVTEADLNYPPGADL
ncbi:hypothetical protein [Desulfogranum mediterraneum]|uniref:hypothetical protein n=1 Tax=Desulfogranum mediterraneum TaxID=160661 RepID=UPI00041286E2|nr:hypothetical protein [Desulfogranum mediterraneum]